MIRRILILIVVTLSPTLVSATNSEVELAAKLKALLPYSSQDLEKLTLLLKEVDNLRNLTSNSTSNPNSKSSSLTELELLAEHAKRFQKISKTLADCDQNGSLSEFFDPVIDNVADFNASCYQVKASYLAEKEKSIANTIQGAEAVTDHVTGLSAASFENLESQFLEEALDDSIAAHLLMHRTFGAIVEGKTIENYKVRSPEKFSWDAILRNNHNPNNLSIPHGVFSEPQQKWLKQRYKKINAALDNLPIEQLSPEQIKQSLNSGVDRLNAYIEKINEIPVPRVPPQTISPYGASGGGTLSGDEALQRVEIKKQARLGQELRKTPYEEYVANYYQVITTQPSSLFYTPEGVKQLGTLRELEDDFADRLTERSVKDQGANNPYNAKIIKPHTRLQLEGKELKSFVKESGKTALNRVNEQIDALLTMQEKLRADRSKGETFKKHRKEDIAKLIRTNPVALSRVLASNPEMASLVCEVGDKILSQQKWENIWRNTFMVGGLALAGTVLATAVFTEGMTAPIAVAIAAGSVAGTGYEFTQVAKYENRARDHVNAALAGGGASNLKAAEDAQNKRTEAAVTAAFWATGIFPVSQSKNLVFRLPKFLQRSGSDGVKIVPALSQLDDVARLKVIEGDAALKSLHQSLRASNPDFTAERAAQILADAEKSSDKNFFMAFQNASDLKQAGTSSGKVKLGTLDDLYDGAYAGENVIVIDTHGAFGRELVAGKTPESVKAKFHVLDHHGPFRQGDAPFSNTGSQVLDAYEKAAAKLGPKVKDPDLIRDQMFRDILGIKPGEAIPKNVPIITDNIGDAMTAYYMLNNPAIMAQSESRAMLRLMALHEDFGHFGTRMYSSLGNPTSLQQFSGQAVEHAHAAMQVYDDVIVQARNNPRFEGAFLGSDRFNGIDPKLQQEIMQKVQKGLDDVFTDPKKRKILAQSFRKNLADSSSEILAKVMVKESDPLLAGVAKLPQNIRQPFYDNVAVLDGSRFPARGQMAEWGGSLQAHSKPYQIRTIPKGDKTGYIISLGDGRRDLGILNDELLTKLKEAGGEGFALRDSGLLFNFGGTDLAPQKVFEIVARHLERYAVPNPGHAAP